MSEAPPQVLRALQLKEIGRYEDAATAFRAALAEAPTDTFVLHHLASCLFHLPGRHREALEAIDSAISFEPNQPDHHILRAFILCVLDRPKDALTAARAALALSPTSDAAFTAEAQAHLQLAHWSAAEAAARQALALDADNSTAANQLAQALRLQNKNAENAGHLAGMLARDPDDPYTHANAGWAALQGGRHREAETHFREALRLSPNFESAREGLLNSFRARSPLYRAYLGYCFAMQRLGAGARWAVIFGLYFAVRFTARLAGWLGIVLGLLYVLFVVWIWVARPVGNLMLLFDRFARYALRRSERIEAVVVSLCLFTGIPLLAASAFFDSLLLLIAGAGLVAVAFPFALTFTNGSVLGRWLFGSIAGFTLFGTAFALVALSLPALSATGVNLFIAGCIGCMITTWIGNFPALRREAA